MKKILTLLIIITIVLSACSKEGPMGPQGPEGPAGPEGIEGPEGPRGYVGATGAQGPAGPQGDTGQSGSDAEINFQLVEANLSDFIQDPDHKVWGYTSNDVSNIPDDAIVSVFAYLDINSDSYEWAALPINHYFGPSEKYNHFSFTVSDTGNLNFYIRSSSGEQPYTTMTDDISYRVFILNASGKTAFEEEGLDIHNYEDLKQFTAAF